jgi:ubiquinone/menaquinone biosynthesis C-methylase UbiE
MQISVNEQLQTAYKNQYKDDLKEWRSIGAKQKVKNIVQISQGKKFGKVLEVGAGDGSILAELDKINFAQELYALEISESGLATIEARNLSSLKEAQLFDGYKLPYADQSFDLIILSHVLEHVEYERLILREIKRVAKMAIIEVPKDYRFGVDKKIKHFLSYGHINLYTPSSLKFLLQSEGFTVLQELNSLYSKETFLFGQKNQLQLIKAHLTYWAKQVLTHTPFTYINQKFINTITVLVAPNKQGLEIF